MLDTFIQNSDPIVGPNSVIVIPILKKYLHAAACSLSQFEADDVIDYRDLNCSPREILQVVYTIMMIVANPSLGIGTMDVANEDKKSFCFIKPDGTFDNIVKVYLEFMRSEEGVHVGWRIFIHSCAPTFNLERGLMTFFAKKQKERETDLKKRVAFFEQKETVVEPILSKNQWVTEGVGPYMDEVFNEPRDQRGYSAHTLPLSDFNNPASTRHVFSFRKSCDIFRGIAADHYLQEATYYGEVLGQQNNDPGDESSEDDASEGGMFDDEAEEVPVVLPSSCIRFSHGAYFIEHSFRNPDVFFHMDISREPDLDNDNLPRAKRLRLNRNRVRDAKKLTLSEDHVYDEARLWLENASKNQTPEQIAALKKSKTAADLFTSVCFNSSRNVGGTIVYKWFHDQKRLNDNFSVCTELYGKIDPRFSHFGNEVTRELYLYELQLGTSVLHAEIFLHMTVLLAAFDINEPGMRFNIAMLGDPAAGKSWVHDIFEKMSIPGVVYRMTTSSEKADTSAEKLNGCIIAMDEIGKEIMSKGDDGSGNSALKELLTKCRVKHRMLWMSSDGMRNVVETETERFSPLIGNTNSDHMPDAFKSRIYVRYIPMQTRSEIDQQSEIYRMKVDKTRKFNIDRMSHKYRCIQAIIFMYYVKKDIHQMPAVDMSIVHKISAKTMSYLTSELSCTVSPRDQMRIMMYTKTLCLYSAITKVFFSGTVIPPNTPWSDSHLYLLNPYLIADREHYYFAFSMMSDMIVSPSLNIILKAFQSLVVEEPDDEKKYGQRMRRNKNSSGIDHNYFAISLSSMTESSRVIPTISKQLIETIKGTTPHELAPKSVMKILDWLMVQKKMTVLYDKDGNLTQTTRLLDVARVQKTPSKFTFEINRQYINEFVNQRRDIIKEAILHTVDKFYPHDTIVTGETYRYGYELDNGMEISLPFLFKTIDVREHKASINTPLTLERDTFTRFGEDLLLNKVTDTEPVSRMYKVKGCIEEFYHQRLCSTVFATREEITPNPPLRVIGDYPQVLVNGYLSEFDNDISSINKIRKVSNVVRSNTDDVVGANRIMSKLIQDSSDDERHVSGSDSDTSVEDHHTYNRNTTSTTKRSRTTNNTTRVKRVKLDEEGEEG